MIVKKKYALLLMAITVLLLAACGGSVESKMLGSWKAIEGDEVVSYMEINEERFTIRSGDDTPMTVEYILTETQDDNFILEALNPETGLNEFLFEGFFENKDTITLLGEPDDEGEKNQLIRVDSIAEEMKKDEKIAQEQEKKDQAVARKEAEKQEKEQEALDKEEAKKMLEEERARASEEEKLREEQALADEEEKRQQEERERESAIAQGIAKQRAAEANGSNTYMQKADNLNEEIITEAEKYFEQDMQSGFYGQYYDEWDALLNEVWGELKTVMSQSAFENLKKDQNDWIKMKEQNFAEMPEERSYQRAEGMDYLAAETKDRTYYLIQTYLE